MVETDSYDKGVEGILTLEESGRSDKLVCYCSGSPKTAKQAYDTAHRALLAVEWTIFSESRI